jgi:hypothetical protein
MSFEADLAKSYIESIARKNDENTDIIYQLNENIKALDLRLQKVEEYINKKSTTIGFNVERTDCEELLECGETYCTGK